MSAGPVFLETSALLRALFGEPGADEVHDRLAGAGRVVASRLLRVETERAVLRGAVSGRLPEAVLLDIERELRNVWAHVELWEITRDICELAGRLAPRSALRSLDAIHLATFHRLRQRAGDAEILTFDRRLLDALAAT